MILGGDDMDDHGSVDGGGNAVNGWLYIQRAIENIGPNVTRSANDGSIAALGSAAGSIATSSDAGASIDLAGSKTGRTVTHYEGAAAIDTFFTNLASAATNPAIIHLAGGQATNDLRLPRKQLLHRTPPKSRVSFLRAAGCFRTARTTAGSQHCFLAQAPSRVEATACISRLTASPISPA